MSEDIVVQLRGWSEGSSDDSRRMVWLMRQSADTIEALRAENARLKTQVQFASETDPAMRAEAAEAQVEALRGEVDLIKTLGVGAALETVAQKERAQKAEAENARLTEERDSAQRVGIQTMRERDEARADEELMSKAKQACEAENARLKGALVLAQEAMRDRRDYCLGWEWKYKADWDAEDEAVSKALAGETT